MFVETLHVGFLGNKYILLHVPIEGARGGL